GRMGVYLSSGGTPTPRMFIDDGGNVNIGPTSTGYTLYVNGNIGMGSAGGGGKTIWDIAEDFPAAEDVEPADVVVIDSEINQRIVKSSMPYDTMVAGVISSSPGFLIDMEDSDTPLALAGRVPCKVTTENGPIKRGDLLVTSSKPGYAMKASPDKLKPGMVLGKALEPLGEGEGKIVLLVTLQ
ncbi:MAG: collagen-like protein, partial [Candidatus Omnitrophica bacterium]|nr:collagen-like protein [Candidatus Omnitrophota bacterium]